MNPRHAIAAGLMVFTCAWPHAGATQSSGAPQAFAATQTGKLPVRRVVLYKSGIGYFEHVGLVAGDQTLSIDLTSGQLDDVLKSLTTLDLGGGRISGITYSLGVPPGRYTVLASLEGFDTQSREVVINAGVNVGQVFALPVGAVNEAVAVQSSMPQARPMFRSRGIAGGVAGGVAPVPPPFPAPPPPAAVDELMRAMESSAQAVNLGDLFEYKLKQPVTIRRNQSALVPIVQSEVTVEKVSLWNAMSGRSRPLRAVWITNSTGLTLDGGSVTLIEGEAFAGEGLIEPLKPSERRLLSYAADLAVLVDAKRDSVPQRVTRISIARGVVLQRSEDRSRATYTIRNEDAAARQVVIEHPVRAGWELGPGLKPAESAATAHRFRVAVEPRATATLIVDESRPVETRYQVSSLTSEQIALIAKSGGADATIETRLAAIVAKQSAVAALDRDMRAKTQELSRISEDQQRVRENMKALKGSDAERDLIQRYTRQLSAQEDRIEALTRERAALEAQRKAAQAELDALIEALTLDVAVKGA